MCPTPGPGEFQRAPADYVIVKPWVFRLFPRELDLDPPAAWGGHTVLLAGTTPNCIPLPPDDALSLDYDAVVLSDCTPSSVTPPPCSRPTPGGYAAGGRPHYDGGGPGAAAGLTRAPTYPPPAGRQTREAF